MTMARVRCNNQKLRIGRIRSISIIKTPNELYFFDRKMLGPLSGLHVLYLIGLRLSGLPRKPKGLVLTTTQQQTQNQSPRPACIHTGSEYKKLDLLPREHYAF